MIHQELITTSHAGDRVGDQHGLLNTGILPGDLLHVLLQEKVVVVGSALNESIVSTYDPHEPTLQIITHFTCQDRLDNREG